MTVYTNKRRYVRVQAKGVAAYLHLDGHRKGCVVDNISAGGLYLRTDRFFPVGTQLTFELLRKDTRQAFTVTGWVVGVITPELAIKTKMPLGVRIQFGRQKVADSDDLQSLLSTLRRGPGAKPRAGLEVTRIDEAALLDDLDDLEEPVTKMRTRPRAPSPKNEPSSRAESPSSRAESRELAELKKKVAKLEAELDEKNEQLALAMRLLKTRGLSKS